MNNLVTSLIRTYVPIVVGGVASFFVSKGIELDADTQAGLIVALTGILQAVYYLTARLLEKRYPQFSVLLGTNKAPVYKETK